MYSNLLRAFVIILVLLLLLLLYLFNTKAFKYRLFCEDSHTNYLVIENEETFNLEPYSSKPCECVAGSDVIEIDSDLLGELQSGGIGHSGGGVQGEDPIFRWDIEELQTANTIVSEFIPCPLKDNGDNEDNEDNDDNDDNEGNEGNEGKGENEDRIDSTGLINFIPKFEGDPKNMSKEAFDSLRNKQLICPRKYNFLDFIKDFFPIVNESLTNPINVAILDTPCDRDAIKEYLKSVTNKNFNLQVSNVTCTNPYNTENTNHGTAVVIRFIQKLIENNNTQDVKIGVYNVLDSNGSVRLSSVLCALAEAQEDENSHFNMSFGFGAKNDVFEHKIKNLVNDPTVSVVTCSIGNKRLDVGPGSNINIPSAYALDYAKIKEVIGLNDNSQIEIWSSDIIGSNYIQNTPRLFAAKAVFNGAGGTSFAAPRILADHISGVTFGTEQPVKNSFGGTIISIIEN